MVKKAVQAHFEKVRYSRKPSLFIHIFIALSISTLWTLTIPKHEDRSAAFSETLQTLKLAKQVVEQFKKEFDYVPQNLGAIRTFADYKFGTFRPYDGYASRISYVPLNDRYYILKSFGSDQSENHVGSPEDISASHLPTVAESAPEIFDLKSLNQISLFPSASILGAKPSKGLLRARVIVNKLTAKRYLLVQHPRQPNFEMVAPMSKVEEFLWLPSGYEIVFTVANDDIYKDGVYLWNLMTSEIQAISFEGEGKKSPFSTVGDESFFFSLSGINASTGQIYLFAKRRVQVTLDPRDFYHRDNLYELKLDDTPYSKRKLKKVMQPWVWLGLTEKLTHNESYKLPFTGNPAQLRWLKLPLKGSVESIITAWQDLVIHLSESALFPYGLWWLSSLYGEATVELQKSSPKDAQSLRAYGIEMSKALAELSYAPRYLQGFATHLNTLLSTDGHMPISVTNFDHEK